MPESAPLTCTHADGTEVRNLADVVRRRAAATPDGVALRDGAWTLRFAELDRRSSRAGQWLASLGVGRGDRVGLVCADPRQALEVVYAAAKVGAVPLIANHRLSGRELVEVLADAEPALVVHDDAAAPLLSGWSGPTHGPAAYAAAVERADGTDPGVAPGPGESALLLYTSGTTGRPKGIDLSFTNVGAGMSLMDHHFGLDETSVCASPLPFFHLAGIALACTATLRGSSLLLGFGTTAEEITRTLVDHRVTHTGLVPTLLARIVALPEARAADWSSLRYVVYGSAAMPLELLQDARAVLGCRFLQSYGMTESSGICTALLPEDHELAPGEPEAELVRRLATVGRPVAGLEARVVDGEVCVRGPNVMRGYWRRPDLTAEVLDDDGWLRTGDGGSFDDHGYLRLHDRIKDMIISGGENVFSTEVEQVVAAHPGVAEAAVVAVASAEWGESPYAVVTRTPGSQVTEEELMAWTRERLAHFKCPVGVRFVEDFPRTPLGKIRKVALREQLAGVSA
jgi:acyl-CoA synthetase (AMP-forming)/AMP-acid ligase II